MIPFKHWPKTGTLLLIGKTDLQKMAYDFAKSLLCHTPELLSFFEAGTHPDFLEIKPESNSLTIKIDQIRTLIDWADNKPKFAHYKMGLIANAQALTVQSANALLKILEEPNPHSCFLLLAESRHGLLPTLVSRCFIIEDRAAETLGLADSGFAQISTDLSALAQGVLHPISVAQSWLEKDIHHLFHWMMLWVHHCAREASLQGRPIQNTLWWNWVRKLMEAKQQLEKTQANPTLLLETLLIDYVRIYQHV